MDVEANTMTAMIIEKPEIQICESYMAEIEKMNLRESYG